MLRQRVAQSKKILQETIKRSGDTPLMVMFSGGKDSTVCLHLALSITDNIECIFMESSIDLPNTVKFVKRCCNKFGVKLHLTSPSRDYQGDFYWNVKRWGHFPTIGRNLWCNTKLKIRPMRAHMRKKFGFTPLFKVNGVRRDESSRRNKMYAKISGGDYITKDPEYSGSFNVYPILDWTKKDVTDYIKKNKIIIPTNDSYEKFGVSGCFWCPFYQAEIYKRILKVHPNIYDKIIELEKELNKPSVTGKIWLRDLKEAIVGI